MDAAAADEWLTFAGDVRPTLDGPRPDTVYPRLEERQQDLCDAIRWLNDNGRADDAVDICAAVWPFWMERGHLAEGHDLLALSLERSTGGSYRARAYHGLGVLAFRRGDPAADAHHREALMLARDGGDRVAEGRALGGLARVELRNGDFETARRLAVESLEAFDVAGDDVGRSGSKHVSLTRR